MIHLDADILCYGHTGNYDVEVIHDGSNRMWLGNGQGREHLVAYSVNGQSRLGEEADEIMDAPEISLHQEYLLFSPNATETAADQRPIMLISETRRFYDSPSGHPCFEMSVSRRTLDDMIIRLEYMSTLRCGTPTTDNGLIFAFKPSHFESGNAGQPADFK